MHIYSILNVFWTPYLAVPAGTSTHNSVDFLDYFKINKAEKILKLHMIMLFLESAE